MSRPTVWLVLFASVAVALRLAAIRGDFTLDEVWSWVIAGQCQSPWDVLTFGHDNNHILNTLWLYALPSGFEHKWLFRLPAALASSLALWFGYDLARRSQPQAGTIALVLLGVSHLVIVHGSEARGYGYLMLCTLASYWALDKYLAVRARRWLALFALTSSLGFFAHLTFLFAYAGLVVYSIIRLLWRPYWQQNLLALHSVPLASAAAIYFLYVDGMSIGGGNVAPLTTTLIETLSLLAGGPTQGTVAYLAASIAGVLLVISLTGQLGRDPARGMMSATVIVLAPALTLLLVDAAVLYPRYFLVPVLFAYLLIAGELAFWWKSGALGRMAAAGLLSAYAVSNLIPLAPLVIHGRAEYSAAMRDIANESSGPEITLSSDHDFRNMFVAYFHADQDASAYRDRGKRLLYVNRKDYPRQGTEWFLQHSFEGDPPKPEVWIDPAGNRYQFVRVYPSHSISGWTWWLYRRE